MKKKILTTAKSKKSSAKKSSAKKSSAKASKRARRVRIGITRPYGYLIYSDGTMETKEERKKRLARLDALTLRTFQIAYEDHHRK